MANKAPAEPAFHDDSQPVAFEDADDENLLAILDTALPHEAVRLSPPEIESLFKARCRDQGISFNADRLPRFREFLVKSSSGPLFSAREAGLGEHSCAVLSRILRTPCPPTPEAPYGWRTRYSQLDLSGNRLHDEGALHIAGLLAHQACTLVRLAIANAEISKRGVSAILESLETQNRTLTVLDIHRNHMGQRSCELLGAILRTNEVLYELNVASTGFGADGMREIAPGLAANSTLRILNLAANSLGPDGIRHLVASCFATPPAGSVASPIGFGVTRLNLARNNLGDRGITTLCRALVDTRGKHPLLELDLSENGFTTEGFGSLANLIRQDHTIRVLSLARNVWTAQTSASEFADALLTNSVITRLSLAHCKIYDDAGALILDACSRMVSLQLLDVSNNFLGDESGKMLARCICPSAVSSGTGSLSGGGMMGLSSSPSKSHVVQGGVRGTIARIVADKNRIGDEGGRAITEALRANRPEFLSLRMGNNKLRDSGEELARVFTECNTYVRDADFAVNEMRYEYVVAIRAAVARNLARFKASKSTRLHGQIASLSSHESQLDMTTRLTEEERARLERARLDKVERQRELEELKVDMEREKKELQEKQAAAVQARLDAEARLEEVARETTMVKTAGETKQAILSSRIDNESKKRAAIAKNTRRREQELEEERRRQDEENKPLKEQVDKARKRVAAAHKELTEEQASLREYVETWNLDSAKYRDALAPPQPAPQQS